MAGASAAGTWGGAASADPDATQERIDRRALVTRHNVTLDRADIMAPLSVGNGEFAFTADVTGLQTFESDYNPGIPLSTMSQWVSTRLPTRRIFPCKNFR